MRTIRKNVFETNSSSTHSFSFSAELRDKTEFDYLPDENGVIEVQLYQIFGCEYSGSDNVNDIIQYFCTQSILSHLDYSYVQNKTIDTGDVNHEQLVSIINEAYQQLGLPEVKDVKIYIIPYGYIGKSDRVYLTSKNGDKIFYKSDVPVSTMPYWMAEIEIKHQLEYDHFKDAVMLDAVPDDRKTEYGFDSGDLVFDSLESALDTIFNDEKDIIGTSYFMTQAVWALTHKCYLSFYHT